MANTLGDIQNARLFIRKNLLNLGYSPNLDLFDVNLLSNTFKLYDNVFFDGKLKNAQLRKRIKLEFEVGNCGKGAAGACQALGIKRRGYARDQIKILRFVFPGDFYSKIFASKKIAGAGNLKCYDALQCFQHTFEHELVHFMIFLYDYANKIEKGKGKNIFTEHGKLFQCIVRDCFGHDDFRHSLNLDNAMTKSDFRIGEVIWLDIGGDHNIKVYGIIIKMNKVTATIDPVRIKSTVADALIPRGSKIQNYAYHLLHKS